MPFEKGQSGYTKPPTQWLSGEAQTVTRQLPPALREKFHCKNEEGQQFCLLVERLAIDGELLTIVENLANERAKNSKPTAPFVPINRYLEGN